MLFTKECVKELFIGDWVSLGILTPSSAGDSDKIALSVLLTCVSHSAARAGFAGESGFISASPGNLGALHSCHRAVARFCAFSSLCNRRFLPVCCPK